MSKMYISLADGRAKGFMKWSDAHPERLGDARIVAGEGAVIAAPDLAQAVMTPAEQPHRPWLVPGAGTL
jgi:hypothetical protein